MCLNIIIHSTLFPYIGDICYWKCKFLNRMMGGWENDLYFLLWWISYNIMCMNVYIYKFKQEETIRGNNYKNEASKIAECSLIIKCK